MRETVLSHGTLPARERLCLFSLIIPPPWQRRGHGTTIIRRLEEIAHTEKREFTVSPVMEEGMHALLRKLGFTHGPVFFVYRSPVPPPRTFVPSPESEAQ
jgi:GNAT superfamily N-acetyltransferase